MTVARVAAAHVAPAFLEREATVAKVCSVVAEAARAGAGLIAFPEAFIPAFPVWSALRSPIHNHALFQRLVANSVYVDGPEIAQVCEAAAAGGIVVSLGFNELSRHSVGTLFNSNVVIAHDGQILSHHRKIVPTFYEKLTWSNGDGAGLVVSDTICGRVGALICGENTNPLARYTMMAQREEIHISTYPPMWPTHAPTELRNYDLANSIRIRAGAHSFEAKAFNVVSSGYMDKPMREFLAELGPEADAILEASPRSISLITTPSGETIGKELCADEGILYAEIDTSVCVEPKQFHDVSGGYNRFDIFHFTVNRQRNEPVRYTDELEQRGQVDQEM